LLEIHQHLQSNEERLTQGVDVIIGVLTSSPLMMWINPSSFQEHLLRTLPEVLKADELSLEFF